LSQNLESVNEYINIANAKTELERKEQKTKTGIFTGTYAINPINNVQIPIYVADYVLNNYATGSIMGVPAHDKRDYDFAIENNIEIKKVISSENDVLPITNSGKYINSEFLNDFTDKNEAIKKTINVLQNLGVCKLEVTTKLHD
jgi:leucyl-tRNA synthetase